LGWLTYTSATLREKMSLSLLDSTRLLLTLRIYGAEVCETCQKSHINMKWDIQNRTIYKALPYSCSFCALMVLKYVKRALYIWNSPIK